MKTVEINNGGIRGFMEEIINGRHSTAIVSKQAAPIGFELVNTAVAVRLRNQDSDSLRVLYSDVR